MSYVCIHFPGEKYFVVKTNPFDDSILPYSFFYFCFLFPKEKEVSIGVEEDGG